MSVDYYKILEKYNLEKGILRGDELLCCCPLHDDKNPSFSINLKTGKYICFAGCGAGDFIDLISKLENVGRASAEDLINNDSDDKNTQLDRLNEELNDINYSKTHKIELNEEIDENILSGFDYNNYDYMIKRGFSENILKQFEIGFYNNNITIPIRDENGKLIAVLARPIADSKRKYYPLIPQNGYKKHLILYGLHLVEKISKDVIIVEGHFDVLKAFQAGIRCAVAIQGSNLSEYHERTILRRFDRVIIAVDNDKAGKLAKEKIIKKLKGKIKIFSFKYKNADIKDIGDMTEEQINEGIDEMELIY